MKIRYAFLFAILLGISNANAATLYVSLTSTNPVAPYASWNTAAVTIQDAIDASSTNDLILVTDGVYQTGGMEIDISNRVAVTTPVTIQSINGPAVTKINGGNIMRCVYLTSDSTLIGFTLENGYVRIDGGGALCADSTAVVSNCVLTGNSGFGGGAYGGTLDNCVLTENQFCAAIDCTLNNSLVASNSDGGTSGCTLNNCTVVHNSGGGVGGVGPGYFNNCIIYYNNPNYQYNAKLVFSFNNCDTTPSPPGATVENAITNEPLFVDTNDDFHLQSNSPCINSGNSALVVGATDFDGNPRIAGGTVDIGAYEYQTPVTMTSYAFLEQYGLPISTNIDTSDLDGTGFDVYQDWIAGLNPTNPASVLTMLAPAATNNASGITVSWQSVSGIMYLLQRSTNLPNFITIRHHVCAQGTTTSFTDCTATNNLPYFYRVGVTAP